MLANKQAQSLMTSSRGWTYRGRAAFHCQASSKAKFFVGGNWKSNGTTASVKELVKGLNAGASKIDPKLVDIVIAPTFVHLDYVAQNVDTGKFKVSAQNMWLNGPGAYTGEIAGETLQDMGVNWVILGHSERRALCGESNDIVALKAARALELGMYVLPCVGETLEQRQAGHMFDVLEAQMQALITHIQDWSKVVIAYEPIWAIGTGVVATPEQAQEVHAYLRKVLESKLGKEVASKLRILYGGSVNDKNCEVLAGQPDVDGFLVGTASLQAQSFLTIIAAHSAKKVAV